MVAGLCLLLTVPSYVPGTVLTISQHRQSRFRACAHPCLCLFNLHVCSFLRAESTLDGNQNIINPKWWHLLPGCSHMIYRILGQPNKNSNIFEINVRGFICLSLWFFRYLGRSEEKNYTHILFSSSGKKMLFLLGTLSESQRYKLQDNWSTAYRIGVLSLPSLCSPS